MIGQTQKKEQIQNLIYDVKFPRFCLLVGERGSGKTTLAKWIGEMLNVIIVMVDTDIDSIRDMIDKAYSIVTPTIYIIANADNMSVPAKNALLKVTEEPPNNARFIMTLTNTENTLATIRSRATVFYMDGYSTEELLQYYHEHYGTGNEPIIKTYCTVLGDIDLLCSYDCKAFYDYVQTVVEHIDKVSGSNAFKIAQKIDLGSDEEKYDLALFWKAFSGECMVRMKDHPFKYISGVNVTCKYLSELRIAGVNKQMCFDNWLLDIRREWMQYAKD